MNNIHDSNPSPMPEERQPLTVIPMQSPPPPTPRPTSPFAMILRWMFSLAFIISIAFNFFLFLMVAASFSDGGVGPVYERFHSGEKKAEDKIAVVKVDGVIMEGTLNFVHKQIEEAASDDHVKAVVLRINSPGGSITASDDLFKRLKDLRDGKTPGHTGSPKPIVVSMGPLAASGGYYIAMPAKKILAERTTITGSIGVYAAFPNIAGLADKYGFGLEVIKAGDVKDSGSMFHKMKPEERRLWQDMVDHAYKQFLDVVEEGRPNLKDKLKDVIIDETVPVLDEAGKEKERVKYVRRRADGGIYTAETAMKYGLIDKIGYLEDAIDEAAQLAGLGKNYRAVVYERPPTLMDILTKSEASQTVPAFNSTKLSEAASPRLWYLAPQSELAGFFAIVGRK